MVNIADKDELIGYLMQIGCMPSTDSQDIEVDYFTGGVSGTVAFVTNGKSEIILKQALGQLKVATLWKCDPGRLLIEKRAVETYFSLLPDNTLKLLSYDGDNHILVRQAAPRSAVMWRTCLQNGFFDFGIAEKVILAILIIHNKTAGNENISRHFSDRTYFVDLRQDPYIRFVAERYPELRLLADEIIDYLASRSICLIHGDFSPKNILVDRNNIYIIDHEVAVYGNPCFDLAFFSNHFLLKTVRYRKYGATYVEMLRFMLKIYLQGLSHMSRDEMTKYTVKTLILLFIARIDGKSPVDYITDEKEKNVIREVALTAAKNGVEDFETFFGLLRSTLTNLDKYLLEGEGVRV